MNKIICWLASIGLMVQLTMPARAYVIPTPAVNFNQTVGNTVNKVEVAVPVTPKIANTQTTKINQATVSVPAGMTSAVSNIVKRDNQIKNVEIKDTQVKVDYQQSTKIFGLIPARFNLHISADPSKKQLNISRPWWTIFSNTNVRKIFNNLQSGMNAIDQMNLSTTQQKQNQVIQTISNILK